jgi:hypothetical protein
MRGVPSQGRDDPLAFGSAVHAALQLSIGGEIPSPARLDALAKQNLLGAGARGRLERAVAAFLSSSVAERLVGYELRRELPFALDVGRSLLVGTMDLIGERAGHAIVVDYKTGRPDGATDRGPRHSAYAMQARCYALAALRRGAPDAEVVFVSLEADDPNTPAFAEKYTADDADAIVAEVNAVAQRVALGDTRPLKAYDGMVCRGCPALGGLCPIDPPRRAAQAGRRRH